jgi:serine/threonine protein kinase
VNTFPPPEGTTFLAPLDSGTVFHVALVRDGEATLVCKRLLPRVREEPAARAAMAREGLVLGRARHPALPALRGLGTDAAGPYLVETFIPGASVRALVEAWRARGQDVPAHLVAHVAASASAALAALHGLADARGPILFSHGDLCPEHVMLGPHGEVAFIDLGAARSADTGPALATADRGTLPYAAPEVARGEAPPDQRADVYALAATLLHLAVSGPIAASVGEAALLLTIGERGISPALCDRAALPPGAREALKRALALDPAERLADAAALAEALR